MVSVCVCMVVCVCVYVGVGVCVCVCVCFCVCGCVCMWMWVCFSVCVSTTINTLNISYQILFVVIQAPTLENHCWRISIKSDVLFLLILSFFLILVLINLLKVKENSLLEERTLTKVFV